MAKKVVAGYKDKTIEKNYIKLIKMIKNEKGHYSFVEKMIRKSELENETII